MDIFKEIASQLDEVSEKLVDISEDLHEMSNEMDEHITRREDMYVALEKYIQDLTV